MKSRVTETVRRSVVVRSLALWMSMALFSTGCSLSQPPDVGTPQYNRPVDVSKPIALGPSDAVVVIGSAVANARTARDADTAYGFVPFGQYKYRGVSGGWIRIDPAGNRLGDEALSISMRPRTLISPNDPALTGVTRYDAFRVAPGIYGLGWLQSMMMAGDDGIDMFEISKFSKIEYGSGPNPPTFEHFFGPARATPHTPYFTARPGEVVYVGDLDLDYAQRFLLRWSLNNSENGARSFLKSSGLDSIMTTRLMTRLNGEPIHAAGSDFDAIPDQESAVLGTITRK